MLGYRHVRWMALILVLILVFSVTGCAGQSEVEELRQKNQALEERITDLEQEISAVGDQKEEVTIYVMQSLPTDFRLVPEVHEIERQDDMPKAALEELIRANPVFKDTRVIDVAVKDFIAYPNFSQEITRMSVGSSAEALAVAAIANTLIKFPGVEKVQILIEGEEAESLAGHVDITEPTGRNEAVLLLNGTGQ